MHRTVRIAVVAGSTLLAGVPVRAHHSMVMYDRTRTITLEGTVVELRWSNPHVFLVVNGKLTDDAAPAVWLLETSSPNNLLRLDGWSATALKAGDRVRVDINPLHEGEQKSARLTKVILVDTGQQFGTAYRDPDLARPR